MTITSQHVEIIVYILSFSSFWPWKTWKSHPKVPLVVFLELSVITRSSSAKGFFFQSSLNCTWLLVHVGLIINSFISFPFYCTNSTSATSSLQRFHVQNLQQANVKHENICKACAIGSGLCKSSPYFRLRNLVTPAFKILCCHHIGFAQIFHLLNIFRLVT